MYRSWLTYASRYDHSTTEAEPLAEPTEVRYYFIPTDSFHDHSNSDVLAPNILGYSTLTLSLNDGSAEPYRSTYKCF